MAATRRSVLDAAAAGTGITAALVVQLDGTLTDASPAPPPALQPLWTAATGALTRWTELGLEVHAGAVRAVLFEHAQGLLCAVPLTGETALVIIADRSCGLGKLHQTAAQARDALRAAPPEPARVAAAPAPRQPSARRPPRPAPREKSRAVRAPQEPQPADRAVNASEPRDTSKAPEINAPAPGAQPGGRAAAAAAREIIVTGVGTFRLATRLVHAVSQLAGVRAARLRTYAPGTLSMNVVLDASVTLAAVAEQCGTIGLDVVSATDEHLVLSAAAEQAPTSSDGQTGTLP